MPRERSDRDIAAMMKDSRWLEDAMTAASRRAIRMHRFLGIPIAIWRDGQVVVISADEVGDDGAFSPRAR